MRQDWIEFVENGIELSSESHEKVKVKAMDDEVGSSDVAVEHFTREEYKFLKNCMGGIILNEEAVFTLEALAEDEDYKMAKSISNKLYKMLKEKEK